MLISDKADFTASKIIRSKEEHYIMISRPLPQDDATALNVYVPVKTCEAKTGRIARTNR